MAPRNSLVVSFVSFKGGSGRSVSLANIAYQYAKRGYRVGCVDFDIEGGGLHKILEVDDNDQDSIQHYLMDDEDRREYFGSNEIISYDNDDLFLKRLVIDVRKTTQAGFRAAPEFTGEIFLVQAKPDARATGLVDTGANLFYRFNRLLEMFGRLCELDYILIDCRSGISALGLPGLAYCSVAAVFLRWGTQHRYGTERLLSWYLDWLARGDRETKVLLVASTMDPDTPQQLVADYCSETLNGAPRGHVILPIVDVLKTRDIVLWEEKHKEFQRGYDSVANALARFGE